MNMDDELKQWQQQWRETPVTKVDVTALTANARRLARREKIVAVFELLGGVGSLVLGLVAAAIPGIHLAERIVFVALAMLVGGFTVWAVRQRRRNWQRVASDASALIAAERQRLRRRLAYWRASAWIVSGLWLALVVTASIGKLVDARGADGWLLSAAINLFVVIGTLAWARVVRNRVSRRMVELDKLEADG